MHARAAAAATASSTRSCPTAPTASASRWCDGWRREDSGMDILGPRRDVGAGVRRGRLDPGVDRRRTKRRAEDGTLKGPLETATYKGKLLRRPVQQQHPAAVVPLRPRARRRPKTWDEMIDMAPRPRQAGQAALHRDPGQPVRGRHRLVQHAARERRRQRPHPGRQPALAGPAGRHAPLTIMQQPGHLAGGRPVAVRSRWRTTTGWPWSRARPPSSSTTPSSTRR